MSVERLNVPCQINRTTTQPEYANSNDAGADLKADIPVSITLWPGHRKAIPTGLRVAIPEGYEMQIRSRSGLSLNHGVVVANAPGTIDPGFRGEVKVILQNTDPHKPFTIEPGARIAQAIIAPVIQAIFESVETLDETVRGNNGFGSTGI